MNRSFNAHECLHAQALHGTPLASFFSRVFAFLIDFLVVLVLVILVGLPAAFYAREQGQTQQIVIRFEPFHNLWGLVALVAYFGFITFVARGQTVGKRLLAIRVVSLASDRLTLWNVLSAPLAMAPPHWRQASASSSSFCTRIVKQSMTESLKPLLSALRGANETHPNNSF